LQGGGDQSGAGMWTVRDAATGAFLSTTGFHARPDGRGIALRFALVASAQCCGYASEAAGAALRFGHERAGFGRTVAVARGKAADRSARGAR
jgi:RimJ/RimL family protein N-acetyltransferase